MRMHFFCLILLLVPVFGNSGSGSTITDTDARHGLYADLNLSATGLSEEVFQLALKGYQKLESLGRLHNPDILTIVDFSQSSRNKRFYVIDLIRKVLLFNTYVAHGRNTGTEFADRFSNKPGSYQSSLGFYVTGDENTGSSVGLSLILEGLEKGFNDNAVKREIIIHGAEYATEDFIRKTGRLGRSFGCPSLPPDMIRPVVEKIKEGSCLFIYHKDKNYISSSSLLN